MICQEQSRFFREMYKDYHDTRRPQCWCPSELVLLKGMEVLDEDLTKATNYNEMADKMKLKELEK